MYRPIEKMAVSLVLGEVVDSLPFSTLLWCRVVVVVEGSIEFFLGREKRLASDCEFVKVK